MQTAAAAASGTAEAVAAAAHAADLWYDVAVGAGVFPFDVVGLRGSPAGDPSVLQQLAAATAPGAGQGRRGSIEPVLREATQQAVVCLP
jgi:hypothetical protein